ncbi:MAG: hypothetical protein COA54_00745 [Thiotrichaceae bacterium]|nr:MAG: hypothetical protein COA54_00745 [Thiotrichaceae bacterium]
MPKDGRYSARSHGRRCGYAQGWAVFRKEPWKAVRLYPRMDGMAQAINRGALKISRFVFHSMKA